jgi:hypothetical protein
MLLPRPEMRIATRGERCRERLGAIGLDDEHHADAAVERAEHLVLRDRPEFSEPAEDRRHGDAREVDPRRKTPRDDARDVVGEPAAGDVGKGLDAAGVAEGVEERLHVNAGRREERPPESRRAIEGRRKVERHFRLRHNPADERKPVRVKPGRGEAEDSVARRDVIARQHAAALDGADSKAGEVEILAVIHARHLGRLAADQRRPGHAAAPGDAGEDRHARRRLELRRGEIVEEEQRLGTLDDEVVDAHRHEIDADSVEDAGVDGDPELRPDAIGRRHQDRVGVSRRREVEEAAEPADLGIGAAPPGRPDDRLDRLDEGVAGVDIDPRIGIGRRLPLAGLLAAHLTPPIRAGIQAHDAPNASRTLAPFRRRNAILAERDGSARALVRLRPFRLSLVPRVEWKSLS